MVNRIWLHHFGQRLVRTPSDFGLRSEPPTHPELLDYLAGRFMDDGWSIKKLHRLIMLSARLPAEQRRRAPQRWRVDPENRLLWQMNRRRLDFEAMRDSLLAVAGQLDRPDGRPVGGPDEGAVHAAGEPSTASSTGRTCPACSAPSTSPAPTPAARSGTARRCRSRPCS